MDQPLVSICTPCYNHEKYLEDYIESIIMQDYPNIELIISDDSSKDNSLSVIEKHKERLKKRFVRVEIIQNKNNVGITKNCNIVTTLAKGKYIKLFASDDIMFPNCISEAVNFMEENLSVGVLLGGAYVVPDEYKYGTVYGKYSKTSCLNNNLLSQDKILWNLLYKGNFICAPGVMIRKKVYENNGYYDENAQYEDYEFWLKICKKEKFYYINNYNVCYRKANTSISNLNLGNRALKFRQTWNENIYVVNKFKKSFPKNKQMELITQRYNDLLMLAVDYNLLKEAWMIFWKMKRKHISVSNNVLKNIKKKLKYNIITRRIY